MHNKGSISKGFSFNGPYAKFSAILVDRSPPFESSFANFVHVTTRLQSPPIQILHTNTNPREVCNVKL